MSGLDLHDCPSAATISLVVPVAHSSKNTRRTRSVFRAEADGTGERGALEQTTFESAATPGHSNTDKEVQPTMGRCPRKDPALSERELTRLRVQAYRARQHQVAKCWLTMQDTALHEETNINLRRSSIQRPCWN
jgi:hypothetical protein